MRVGTVAIKRIELELDDGSKFIVDGDGITTFDIQEKPETFDASSFGYSPHKKFFRTGRSTAIMTIQVEMIFNDQTNQYETAQKNNPSTKLLESRKRLEDKS